MIPRGMKINFPHLRNHNLLSLHFLRQLYRNNHFFPPTTKLASLIFAHNFAKSNSSSFFTICFPTALKGTLCFANTSLENGLSFPVEGSVPITVNLSRSVSILKFFV